MNQVSSPAVMYVLFAWSTLWKGLALWRSAKLNQRNWFIVILVIGTLGILEIAYLFYFAKEKMKIKDLIFWKK